MKEVKEVMGFAEVIAWLREKEKDYTFACWKIDTYTPVMPHYFEQQAGEYLLAYGRVSPTIKVWLFKTDEMRKKQIDACSTTSEPLHAGWPSELTKPDYMQAVREICGHY